MAMRLVAFALVVVLGGCRVVAPAPSRAPSASVASPAPPSVVPSSTDTPVALRACAQADVTASFEGWGAALGSTAGSFRLAPRSADVCALPDRPPTTFVDERGDPLNFTEPWPDPLRQVPVRAATGKDATFVVLLWSDHGPDPSYVCARRSAPMVAVELDGGKGPIRLQFPAASRPVLCIDPMERVFVEVAAR